ncbi:DNA alkylation repair protein [Candidatus Woesearchaeota archaeon]|nr:MAG: DNA alkylation repair enzyme superfamily [archaeon GW2011_AR18]MBS3161352.1 DNA alkylation repair protein [Candidatus Woesearchaeota archaeon]HIH25384.1 DNA alkylation repair protein [Nanoarchaeota archaeon]
MSYDNIVKLIAGHSNTKKSEIYKRFFKTSEGDYGHGDIFLGLTVPQSRIIAKKFHDLSFVDLKRLLNSKIHEHRLVAIIILVERFNKNPGVVYDFYLDNIDYVNNWDLVDLSADKIVGKYLFDKSDRSILYRLVKSNNLWHRRISIVSTFYFIKNNVFDDTLKISELLLNDKHDLIHKSVGWMLREVGKRSLDDLEEFLDKYSKIMPRTMLRYSIEKFPEEKRLFYLNMRKETF